MRLNDMQQPLFKTKTFILKMWILSYNSLPESQCNGNFDNLQPITKMSTDGLFCDWLKQLQKVIELTFWQIVVQKYTSAKVLYESTYLRKLEVLLVYCNLNFWQSKRKCDSFLFCSSSLESFVIVHKIFFDFGFVLDLSSGLFWGCFGIEFLALWIKKVFLFNFSLK